MSTLQWRWFMFMGFMLVIAATLHFLEDLGLFASFLIGGCIGYLMSQVVVT